MKKILVLEDDPTTQTFIARALGRDFETVLAGTLAEARKLISQSEFDLFILDRMLPDGDGLSICEEIIALTDGATPPIIFLSTKGEESDRVLGLYAGADDYIPKPFSPAELKARVHAKLRRKSNTVRVGQLEIDRDRHRAFHLASGARHEIDLTRTEFRILATLSPKIDQVFSREQLLEKVWPENLNLTDRVVDTHISNLRKKIRDFGVDIEAVYREGYRLIATTGHSKAAAS